MARSMRPGVRALVLVWGFLAVVSPAAADEIWVSPALQQDLGGLGIGSNVVWPVTAVGASRFAWGVPDNLQAFLSARVVLIPHAPGGAATLNVIVCAAENGQPVAGTCAGPFAHAFTGVANQLLEVDITAELAGKVGAPGLNTLAVVAFTSPTTGTDHFAGLRFSYVPNAPAGLATLGANTFTGTQTAPMFVGDGTNVFNVNANLLDGLDSTAFAATVHGHDVTQITNAARVAGGNTFTGSQVVNSGNLDLDASTAATGVITKNATRFLHDFGGINSTFLGVNAGNFTTTAFGDNTGIGWSALSSLTTGQGNTAIGSRAMLANTTGFQNVALGRLALAGNTTGADNTAIGDGALNSNLGGSSNTAVGFSALGQNATGFNNTAVGDAALAQISAGANNVAVGHIAGLGVTTGSNSIYIGSGVTGLAAESNTIRLGLVGQQTATFVAGIRGTAVAGGEMVVVDANGRLGSSAIITPGLNTVGSAQVVDNSIAPADVSFNFAGSSSKGGAALDLACAACVGSAEVSFGFATPLANTFSGTQTINAGNLDLDASTAAVGNVTKSGVRFLHNFSSSTFLGLSAGNFTMTGAGNTGIGFNALAGNTTGAGNTAIGSSALDANNTGAANTAVGVSALGVNTSGDSNSALGNSTLSANTLGERNAAIGASALVNNSVGSNNVAVGYNAGALQTAGSNNIYLGANVTGVAGEISTMYLGDVGTQIRTFIAGVRGIPTGIPNAVPVVIDSAGQLGTINSSRRFKEDIRDMADASRRLYQLRPVTFRYTQAYTDGSKPINYGLVAEEVADVFPELAVRNADGRIETVHYETLNVLLLNELQKQQKELDETRQRLEKLERDLEALLRSAR